jgi:hypothetical protein
MLQCTDFDPEYLTLASHEAMACKSIGVATAALSNLLKLHHSGKLMSTKEIVVMRNIIRLLLDNAGAQSEVLHYLKYAKKRLSDSGIEYFGSGMTAEKELNWFAGSSWNSGLKAGKANDFELCAEFFMCASEFYGALEDSIENLRMLSKSLILAVAALLAAQKKDNSCLTEALEHLEKAKKVWKKQSNFFMS